jgi:predicted transcriptional regulator of viral defense system
MWNFMNVLANKIVESNLAERIFDERQLADIIGGSEARRYGLVNRALKDDALIRVKRGLYMLDARYRCETIHPFAVAQSLLPGSYISFETALSFYGLIPEAVYTVASVTPDRKTIQNDTPIGKFSFHPLAINDYQFFVGVERHKFGHLTAFVAEPLRALMDLAVLRKQEWAGIEWLTTGMRIDAEWLRSLLLKDFQAIKPVYRHCGAREFLDSLEKAVCTSTGIGSGKYE